MGGKMIAPPIDGWIEWKWCTSIRVEGSLWKIDTYAVLLDNKAAPELMLERIG